MLFLDLAMPGMSGLDALARISESYPEVSVIILSMHDSVEHMHRALKLKAAGYLIKDALRE